MPDPMRDGIIIRRSKSIVATNVLVAVSAYMPIGMKRKR